ASEEVMFGQISTGALSDLEKITKQAYAMITYFGLNKKIGNISFYDSSGNTEYAFTKPYSEKTAQIIDEEVSIMIEAAYIKTKELLKTHKAQLTALAEQLLDKEVIFKEDLERIIGKRPFEKEEAVPVSKTGSASMSKNGSSTTNTATASTTTTISGNGTVAPAQSPKAETPPAPPVTNGQQVTEVKKDKPTEEKKPEDKKDEATADENKGQTPTLF
ncbi:MAG TPA: hypothetical protein VNZ45_18605, partial [Bacteroidia bacterium]|nr:hypothetical protein [Bacteroidia bacterium]